MRKNFWDRYWDLMEWLTFNREGVERRHRQWSRELQQGVERGLDRVARGEPFRYVKAHKRHIQGHHSGTHSVYCAEYCHCESCMLGLGLGK